jgi:hypothetical protein
MHRTQVVGEAVIDVSSSLVWAPVETGTLAWNGTFALCI